MRISGKKALSQGNQEIEVAADRADSPTHALGKENEAGVFALGFQADLPELMLAELLKKEKL